MNKKSRDTGAQIVILAAGIFALLTFAGCISARNNLIRNCSFEREDAHGLGIAEEWPPRFGRLWITLDDTISHKGRKSLKLDSPKRTGRIECCRQKVRVEAGKRYRVSFWWKSEGVDLSYFTEHPESVAHFNFYYFYGGNGKRLNKEFMLVDRSSMGGTHDWTKFETILTAPPGAEKLQIGLGIFMSPGTVWYDDVSVVPLF